MLRRAVIGRAAAIGANSGKCPNSQVLYSNIKTEFSLSAIDDLIAHTSILSGGFADINFVTG
jgi:hypothetical protein